MSNCLTCENLSLTSHTLQIKKQVIKINLSVIDFRINFAYLFVLKKKFKTYILLCKFII